MPRADRIPGPPGVVVALKPSAVAKSRLGALPAALRRELAQAMALDTLAALVATPAAAVVVTDDTAMSAVLRVAGIDARVLAEPEPSGMNAALAMGAGWLQDRGHDPVLAVVGDLPALRPDSVRAVLADVGPAERAVLPDASGVGSTMLISSGGLALDPRFGGASAAAHERSGARRVTAVATGIDIADARTDVDDPAALAAAVRLGVGRHTGRLVERLGDWL